MKGKFLAMAIAMAILPACTQSRSKPVIIKEKIKIPQNLLEECPQLMFAPVENTQDCFNILKLLLSQYSKCANQLNDLQKIVKEFNQSTTHH